jgi:phosphate transport system protein
LPSAISPWPKTVVARDPQIDQIQVEVEKKILRLLALRQPLARDLRQTISALKIATELERIGDLGKSIAKRVKLIDGIEPVNALKGVARMGRLVTAQLKRARRLHGARKPMRPTASGCATRKWTNTTSRCSAKSSPT